MSGPQLLERDGVSVSRDTADTAERSSWWATPDMGALYAAFVAALITQSWFRPGRFIASGDSGPMLDGLDGVTRSWSDALAGTGSSGYRSAALPDGLVFEVVTAMGLSPTFAQRVWYTVVVALCAAVVGWLAAGICRTAAAATGAGVVAVLAPFHFTTLPNLLPMITIGTVAAIAGWAVRAGSRRQLHPAWCVALGVVLAPVAKNPPLLVVVMGAIAVAALAALVWQRCSWRYLGSCVAWMAAASLFWVTPLVLHYASGTPGLEIVAQTDVGAWDWTQRNSGPSNVARLVASWVWGDPDVMGPLAGLDAGVWAVASWALPVAVLASIAVTRRRVLALSLGGAALVLIVLCVGVNPPFGGFNRLLYDHVPGFWLFRQPMSKFGVLLVLLYALLIAIGIDGVIDRWRTGGRTQRRVLAAGASLLAVGIVAFSHPMWTGSVIQGQRGGVNQLPPGRVAVPAAWLDAGAWLDQAPLEGSVAVLPLSDYYQQGTQWGFYGVNDLVSRLTRRPALNLLPGGYYDPAGAAPALLRSLEQAIEQRDGVAASRLMDALGVSYVAVRRDLTTVPTEPTADGEQLDAAAADLPQLQLAAAFDTVHIYQADTPAPGGDRRAMAVRPDLDPDRLADVIATSPPGSAVVYDDEPTHAADAWLPSGGVTSHEVPTGAGTYRFSTRTRSPLLWQAEETTTAWGVRALEIGLRSNVAVDGIELHAPTGLAMPVPDDVVAIAVDGRPIVLGDGPTLFGAASGAELQALAGTDLIVVDSASLGELGNCNNATGASLEQAGIAAEDVERGLLLRAREGSACLSVPLPTPNEVLGSHMWHVRGDVERLAGRSTRVCLWVPSSQRCAAGSPRATSDPISTFDFVAATYAGEDPTGATLVLYADADADTEAVSVFRSVDVRPVDVVGEPQQLPALAASELVADYGDGSARLTIDQDLAVNYLQPFGTEVQDCNNYDDAGPERNRLSLRRVGDGPDTVIELGAARHSACVSATVKLPGGVRHLTVDFEYRSDGPGARWCLRGAGAACTAGASLPSTDGWSRVQVDVVTPRHSPLATPEDYELHIYADGADRTEGNPEVRTVQYRRASVRPTFPLVAVVHPVDEPDAEQVVVQRTAFGSSWSAREDGGAALSGHRVVDGWANGWQAPTDGDAPVRFAYRPDRIVATAVWLLPFVLLGAAVSLLLDATRRGRGAAASRSRGWR